MRTTLVLLFMTGILAAITHPTSAAERGDVVGWCLPNTDSAAVRARRALEEFGSSSDSRYIELRDAFGIPATQPSAIVAVAVDSVCERASRVVDSAHARSGPHQVYVWRFGSYYAVHDTSLQAGEWKLVSFLDSAFAFRQSLGY